MVTVIHNETIYTGAKAAKTDHEVILYDENNHITTHISNIWDEEWGFFSIEGDEWLDPIDIPTEEVTLRADLDYLTMCNEALEDENAVLRADLDFCLMLLGD